MQSRVKNFIPWLSNRLKPIHADVEVSNAGTLDAQPSTIPGLSTIEPASLESQRLLDAVEIRRVEDFRNELPFKFVLVMAASTAKDEGLQESNEDAYVIHAETNQAAVFDGATESFAAQRWARLLAHHWAQSFDWLDQAQREYAEAVTSMELSWAQAAAVERGSFSTMAAIHAEEGGITATIVGDSCLFLLKDGQMVHSLPFTQESQFTSVPMALSSSLQHALANERLLDEAIFRIALDRDQADEVVLATDALSAWLLGDDQPHRWELLRQVTSDEEFTSLVHAERSAERMKVDDSTFVRLALGISQ